MNADARLRSPIFIGGMMKSGTSLLRVLLGRHPNIFAGFETHWFGQELAEVWTQGRESRRLEWLRDLYEVPAQDFSDLRTRAATSIEFFDSMMRYCTERAGKARWAEKTPGNVNHLPLIWRTWPDALFLHVRRDFRDIYASWKSNGKATLDDFIATAEATYRPLPERVAGREAQYRDVSYERLVTDPSATMREVLEFLDEPWVEGIDRNDQPNDEYERVQRVVGVHSTTALSLKREIFSDSVGQWRQTLTATEARAIEAALAVYQPAGVV